MIHFNAKWSIQACRQESVCVTNWFILSTMIALMKDFFYNKNVTVMCSNHNTNTVLFKLDLVIIIRFSKFDLVPWVIPLAERLWVFFIVLHEIVAWFRPLAIDWIVGSSGPGHWTVSKVPPHMRLVRKVNVFHYWVWWHLNLKQKNHL